MFDSFTSEDYLCLCLVTALAGAAVAVTTISLFALRLRRAHPDLWSPYVRVYWSWPGEERSQVLRDQVYSRISDRLATRLLLCKKVGFAVYVILLVGSIVLLALIC